jgi:hypothetical protein
MFRIESRSLKTVSPDAAKRLLTTNNYGAQRKLRPQHVQRLIGEIENDRFTTGHIALATNGDGRRYLMNGQHQLHAIIETGIPVEALIEEATCQTAEDMSMYFGQFDVNESRSLSDLVHAEVYSMGVSWNHRTGPLVATAMVSLSSMSKASKYDRAKLVRNFRREANFVDAFINVNSKHIQKGPVVASMIQTFWKDPKQAEEFWSAVETGEMLTKGDPRLKLRSFLLSVTFEGNGETATRKEVHAKCITAWNAWRRGKPTALKFYPSKPIPTVV